MSAADFLALPPLPLACVIGNASRWYRPKSHPAWALARDLFGVGSNSAIEICRRAGIDPDTKVKDL